MAKQVECSICGGEHYQTFCYNKPKKPIGTVTDITKEWKAKNSKSTDVVNKKFYVKVVPIKAKKVRDSLPELLKLAEIVFNRFIRERDKGENGYFNCMCCGDTYPNDEMDAGHMFGKIYSSLRFDEDNVWGQSQKCNRLEYGNEESFKARVKQFIGEERFNALEQRKTVLYKWDRIELLEIINKYKL